MAGSNESFLVDGPDSVDRIVMPLEDDLGLLLGLPGDHLLVVSSSHEVLSVEIVDIQDLGVVLVVSTDQSSLGEVPVLQGEVGTDGAEVVGMHSKLDAVYSVLVAAEGVD